MKPNVLSTCRTALRATFAAFAASLLATTLEAGPSPSSTPGESGGLQIQLRTDSHTFYTPSAQPRGSFTAIALVANRGGSALPFTFESSYAAAQVFKFRVFNSHGDQLWESDQNVRIVHGETVRKLGPQQTWRRSIQVPLSWEGAPLKPDTYTLEATVDANPQMGATVIFRVLGPTAPAKELVYSVTKVRARHVPTLQPPPEVAVEASGMVSTSGWTNPELRLRGRASDGYLEFDFVAQPPAPDTVVFPALTKISAHTQVPVPASVEGVRVIARTNSVKAPIE